MTDREAPEQRRARLIGEIAADVTALVEPRRHVESYKAKITGTRKQRWYGHVTVQPPLLDQLHDGGAPPAGDEGGSGGSSFESQPPGAFDCFDRLLAIEAGAAWWVSVGFRRPFRRLDPDDRCTCGTSLPDCEQLLGPVLVGWSRVHCCSDCRHHDPQAQLKDNLRQLVGLATGPGVRDVDLRDLAADVARFHRWASVLAGWEQPPRALRASCPLCEKRGTLRVRALEREGMCVHCGGTWDRATIGILAEHVRAEGERLDTPGGTAAEVG